MKIRMTTSMAGQGPSLLPGEVTDQPDTIALAWIEAGLATKADDEEAAEPEPAPEPAPEPEPVAEPEPLPVTLPVIEEAVAPEAPRRASPRPRKKAR